MRNSYFMLFIFLVGMLFAANTSMMEGSNDANTTLVDESSVEPSETLRKVKSHDSKSMKKMDAVIKKLMPAAFYNSPVVLNSAIYSSVTAIWTGAVSSDWNNTGNWMGGVVPTTMDIVSIPNVMNDPIIMNGTNATAQSVMVEAGASLTIAATGSLNLEGATGTPSGGMHNLGTITNNGSLQIGMNISPGEYGLVNEGVFQNNSGGELSVDRTSIMGIWNRMETSEISNAGIIVTGATNGTGGAGIYNEGSIQNNGGEITIDRAGGSAIDNRPNSNIENSGKITIGKTASITGTGVYNFGDFQNLASGEVEVDRANSGIFNNTMSSINSSFINEGKIMIGQVASISGPGIYNNPSGGGSISFDNKVSGEIMLDRTNAGIHSSNNCTINNSGLINIGNIGSFSGFSLGIYNLSTFNNENSGEIKIDKIPRTGIHHRTGTFSNRGKITLGISEINNDFNPGIYIDAPFINLDEAELHIDRYSTTGMLVALNGSLTNAGLILIGLEETGGNNGLFNEGTVENQGTGEIHIDNITDDNGRNGIFNRSNQSFTNMGKIFIGQTVNGGSTGFFNDGIAVNSGEIHIDNVIGGTLGRHGLFNNSFGSFTNAGKIMLGISGSIGEWGIFNSGGFNNNAGGEISIDKTLVSGLRNGRLGALGTFTNEGSLTIGGSSGIGDWGIYNESPFFNSGELSISNAAITALRHQFSTFSNTGQITLGSNGSAGEWGLWIQAAFTNEAVGEIHIDETTNTGLLLFSNTFANNGVVTIGANTPVGDQAIYMEGSLENNSCAELNIYAPLNNAGTLTNFGFFLADTDGTHINNTITNNGVLVYPQGNPIPNVTNQEIIIGPTTDNDCQNIASGFEIAGSSLSVSGVYHDPMATISAGTYNMNTNVFTPEPPFENGVYDLYVAIVDPSNVCTFIAPWQLTGENCCELPVAICQPFTAVLDGNSALVTVDDVDNGSTAGCGLQSMAVSPGEFNCTDVGMPQLVILTVTDVRGTSNSCTVNVTVADNTVPSAQCFNQTIEFNGETSITLDTDDLADGDDNCGVQSIDLFPTSILSSQVGQTVPVQVTVTDLSNNTATCTSQITVGGLPTGWSQNANGVGCTDGNDIDYNASNGTWTATSSNCYYTPPYTSDATAFAQYTLCGNGSITAQVTGISGTSLGWAGVTMRETNAPGAKKAQLTTNMSNFSRREFRTTINGAAFPQQFLSLNRRWLRIVRSGNQFAMYVSPNGVNWAFAGAQTIQMNSCIEIGLVVTNYSSNSTVTATFANVSVFDSNQPAMANSGDLASFDFIEDRQSLRDVKVYPNPTSGQLNIALTGYEGRPVTLEVYNTMGQMLYIKEVDEVQNADEIIDLSSVASGMYLIRVSSEGIPAEMKRVTVAR